MKIAQKYRPIETNWAGFATVAFAQRIKIELFWCFSTSLNSSLIIFIRTYIVNYRNALDRLRVRMNIILFKQEINLSSLASKTKLMGAVVTITSHHKEFPQSTEVESSDSAVVV